MCCTYLPHMYGGGTFVLNVAHCGSDVTSWSTVATTHG